MRRNSLLKYIAFKNTIFKLARKPNTLYNIVPTRNVLRRNLKSPRNISFPSPYPAPPRLGKESFPPLIHFQS